MQATAQGEEAIASLTLQGVGKAKRVADLFCGSGAFALRLCESARVDAFDENAEAIAALEEAARTLIGAKPLAAHRRNLFDNPLRADELEAFDAVVFDPPRVGAAAQAAEIAHSKVPAVVAVSCNAQSFARDARLLLDGGFSAAERDADRPVPLRRPCRARRRLHSAPRQRSARRRCCRAEASRGAFAHFKRVHSRFWARAANLE